MRIRETVRKDGLRIISCKLPHKKEVWVDIVALIGSAYDPPGKSGLFHLFEHMAFKGTKKRTAEELQSLQRKNFTYSNAYTYHLRTMYEVAAIDSKLPQACDYLCDIYLDSIFPSEELRKEKKAVHLEIARNNDDDGKEVWRAINEGLYKSNPIRYRGTGTAEGVNQVTRENLIKQREIWHVPSNTVALALGSVEHDDFVREISKRIPLNNTVVERKYWPDEAYDRPHRAETAVIRPKREKAVLMFGCKLPLDIDFETDELITSFSKIFGGSSTSRLYDELRVKRGLVYTARSSYTSDLGLGRGFYIYAEVHPSKIREAERVIRRTLAKPLFKKSEFEEWRERVLDAFEIEAFEQSDLDEYQWLIMEKISEGKPVREVETEDKHRIEIVKSMSLKDIDAVRHKFIRPEQFAKVLLRS
ncbi:MAG: insulinase family protein [Patescibacteria group bacterium]|nr:insulinase family protein [Patescibacteria group bacterium]MCL5224262.1 insulinase family protein [Patescibacteria group bacterium]